VQGVIRRRILTNFRVDPDVLQRQVPEPFRPKLLDGAAVAGICLIRLEQIRLPWLPPFVGLSSENAAHRMAVCWKTAAGEEQEGVYIPRRDSSSLLNHLVGGRLFPGEHHRASFEVQDNGDAIALSMRSSDGLVSLDLVAKISDRLPTSSRFRSLEEASAFFERGALGYSERATGEHLDGLYLDTKQWRVEPLEVQHVRSSYFADRHLFPSGSVQLDCALLMRDIQHSWRAGPLLPKTARERGISFPVARVRAEL